MQFARDLHDSVGQSLVVLLLALESFPAESAARLGLAGMRGRAEIVVGELDVEPVPGSGTTVVVRIPAPGRRAAAGRSKPARILLQSASRRGRRSNDRATGWTSCRESLDAFGVWASARGSKVSWGRSAMHQVSWQVPRWSYVRREVRILRGTFGSNPLARIWSLAGLATSLTFAGVQATHPSLELAFHWRALATLGFLPLLYAAVAGVYILAPPFVFVGPERIARIHGNTHWVAALGDCDGFRIAVYSSKLRRLVFRFKGRRQALGLDESVDLGELRTMLPRTTRIVDARRRFARRRLLRGRYPRP